MRNRVFVGILLITVVSCLATGQLLNVDGVKAATPHTPTAKADISALIQDPDLLQAWTTLLSLPEDVNLWNGQVLSGEELAKFLLENQIPVVWGNDQICGGGSCSRQYCTADGHCSYEDGKPGIDPIYINATARSQTTGKATRLVNELAHEIFHRMQPFGMGPVTQLEEYWAFYMGTTITGAQWPVFSHTDPLDAQRLQHWFIYSNMPGYLKLEAYPAGVALEYTDTTVQISSASQNRASAASE